LRSGYTTGACAAAAAKGALLLVAGQHPDAVTLTLPGGVSAEFPLHGQQVSGTTAECFVIKDAGDDPDITNGAHLYATVTVSPEASSAGAREIQVCGGVGVGRVTKPGLAVPPGEWAINPVPLRMIREAVAEVAACHDLRGFITVTVSVPDGEERAKKTLNSRLGIIGGLSILGTTGIVRPISVKAWTDTIDAALDVAKACSCRTVVLSTGRSSEVAAQSCFPELPEEAYIMMGDHVAYALQACTKRGYLQPVIACQFAKLLKIACGYENTHAAASELDLAVLKGWGEAAGLCPEHLAIISHANTAREIVVATGFDRKLVQLVVTRAIEAAAGHAAGLQAVPLLCGYAGSVVNH
jgi:cobalt-precorrin-5B (C1)-methyltransferase